MGYTVPATASASVVVSSAIWNAGVRDNAIFFAAPPMVSAQRTSNQSISNDTWTAVSYSSSEDWDTDGMHSTTVNPSRFTATTAGRYLVSAHMSFEANASGRRSVRTLVNGTDSDLLASVSPVSGSATVVNVSQTLALSAGDYVEFQVYQSSGGALNVASSQGQLNLVCVL